jgi:serine/threonine protein kinase
MEQLPMTSPDLDLKAIFTEALEHLDTLARASYLDRACEGNATLRARVETLLKAHDEAGGFLASAVDPAVTSDQTPGPTASIRPPSILEGPGTTIGPYKLLQQIGEGGMGVVFMAEQEKPVRRKVALKVIKPGMDTNQVVARFEAERQALAMMDHPNIARVLDVGATATGRPFFVMELVKGVPITEYCDRNQLTPKERLELFMPVCRAIQHAHQKGIIHRDIKPSNVLVTLHDGQPVPKVIDFGVAKAIDQRLTERTMFTEFGAVIGTLEYMSPEQAEMGALDIDTRSDIYSLGVLLYELLTGTTPLERAKLRKAAFAEVLKRIREEEPTRPSTRLSESKDSLPSISAQRKMEPARLTRLVKGDLDWIVMKSLEKDRTRRYETATGFARDIQRYLEGDAVEACPPSAVYKLRKFARKHRVALVTASAFVALLVVAVGVSALLAVKARRAEAEAENNLWMLIGANVRVEKEMEKAKANAKEAEANQKEAERITDLYAGAVKEHVKARAELNFTARSLQIDLDIGEVQNDPRLGLLHLVRTRKKVPENIYYSDMPVFDDTKGITTTLMYDLEHMPKQLQLNEFATMAVLSIGQAEAPLLPRISHDGFDVSESFLSVQGDRLLTYGADKTARLWDTLTGRQVALLRRGEEKVIEVGLSPDGETAFTHSMDGIVRLWATKNGSLRAETEPRIERLKHVDVRSIVNVFNRYVRSNNKKIETRLSTELSNDRILTSSKVVELGVNDQQRETRSILEPDLVELWDSQTGKFLARFETPPDSNSSPRFHGNGKWIELSRDDLSVFSSETGKFLTRFKFPDPSLSFSPSGNVALTLIEDPSGEESGGLLIRLWDTATWQLKSTAATRAPRSGPFLFDYQYKVSLVFDDMFMIDERKIYRVHDPLPVAEVTGSKFIKFEHNLALIDSGQLFDTRTWRRMIPPKGKKYCPELALFAADGRFLFNGIDTLTEKTVPVEMDTYLGGSKQGWVSLTKASQVKICRLPPPDHLNIPPEILELWAQVVVRGELDEEGAFKPWNEPTWEKKRQELAAKPVPYPDFPFPGQVAADRLHWLRQEYEWASDANKPRLARQLLERAEALGDKAEATRWRARIVSPEK